MVDVLQGRILIDIESNGFDEIVFTTLSGEVYKMHHIQNCCESVSIEDVCGDLKDLLYEPLLTCEERIEDAAEGHGDSATWTFYEFATIKGSVTIRWHGSSNGYYSESVDFEKVDGMKVNPVRKAVESALNERKENE